MVGSLILFWGVFTVVSSECEQQSYIARRNVKYIPRSEKAIAASANCQAEHKPFYVIDHWRKETFLVCSCDVEISGGYCPEVNIGNKLRIQESYEAPCHDFYSTPCPQKYNVTQSHRFMECFEKFGGLSSPQSLFIENQELREKNKKLRKENQELRKENQELRKENQELRGENQELRGENQKLKGENQELRGESQELRRKNQELDKNDNVMKIIVCLLGFFLLLTWARYYAFPFLKNRMCFEKTYCFRTSTSEESRNSDQQVDNINHDQTTNDEVRQRLLDRCEEQGDENVSRNSELLMDPHDQTTNDEDGQSLLERSEEQGNANASRNSELRMNSIPHDQTTNDEDGQSLLERCEGQYNANPSRNSELLMDSIKDDQTTKDQDGQRLFEKCEGKGNENMHRQLNTEDHVPTGNTDIINTVTPRNLHDIQTEDMDESDMNKKNERLGSQEIDDSLKHNVDLYDDST